MSELNKEELTQVISDSVDRSVDQAFQKYGGRYGYKKNHKWLVKLVIILAIIAFVGIGVAKVRQSWSDKNKAVAPVEDHDETLENSKIFGFKAADFATPILGRAQQEKQLIVEEKEASVNTTLTDTGFMNWGIFTKTQVLTIHGKGEYTIDLSKIKSSDISLSDDYVVTVLIPHAELHTVTFDPEKTEIGDTSRGWLAFGDIKLDAEQTKEFESTAKDKLETALSGTDNFQEADRFARLTATEEIQKVVSEISPAYKVNVEFQEDN